MNLRRQWATIKARYPDTILLFRVGDEYQTVDEDAEAVRDVLGSAVNLADTAADMPLRWRGIAVIPFDAADASIAKLLTAGHKVAAVEPIERTVPEKPKHLRQASLF